MTTIGIDETDVAKIASMDGISAMEGSVSMDVLATLDTGESYVVAAHSITSDINRLGSPQGACRLRTTNASATRGCCPKRDPDRSC